MQNFISSVALLVSDYDEAINFYVAKLGFVLIEDIALSENKRWVTVSPNENTVTKLQLKRAETVEETRLVGQQAAGGVLLILQTEDFDRTYREMQRNAVTFLEEPRTEIYGKVAIFKDLYGNKWDLIEKY